MFRCQKINDPYTICGSEVVIEYEKKFSKCVNQRVLVPVGKYNLYERVQTFKDDNNVYKLLERYNNDMSKLVQVQKSFEDLYSAPKTINELNENISNYINSFNNLPGDLKAKFNNNAYDFIKSIGKPDMYDKLNDFYKSKNLSSDQIDMLDKSIGKKLDSVNLENNKIDKGVEDNE